MHWRVRRATVEEITPWRDLFRDEMNCQIVGDSIDSRPGWTEPYFLEADGKLGGYASVAIGGPWKNKPTVLQFFVLPQFRGSVFECFEEVLSTARPVGIEAQTTDIILSVILQVFARDIVCESILYHDKITTSLQIPGATVRKIVAEDRSAVAAQKLDADAEWLMECDGVIVATGGILYHYNRPYGDIYMAVAEPYRRKGFGSLMVQELKKICYQGGSIPGARCNPTNLASRKTLQKAGFVPRGTILVGSVR